MRTPIYDDSLEVQLTEILCKLDENPRVSINPVEASEYLGVTLAVSEEGFQLHVEAIIKRFLEHMNQFAKECIDAGSVKTTLIPTISRLLTNYKQVQYTFTHSPLRMEWKAYSTDYTVVNSSTDINAAKEQRYYRQAYAFFYKTSARQLFFINQLIDTFTTILKANDADTTPKKVSEGVEQQQPVKYRFTLREGVSVCIHDILNSIHKDLRNAGYIDCTLPKFKGVFTSDEPKPIIWLKSYSHLSYMIQQLGKRILTVPKSPSNFKVAKELFYDKKYGVRFNPYRDSPDGKLIPKHKAFFDDMVGGAVRNYM